MADSEFKFARFEDCPDAEERHTPQPDGYIERSEWADRKLRTHTCHRCPTCGFWAVWTRKGSPAEVVAMVACPACGMAAGTPCYSRHHTRWRKNHGERVRAFVAAKHAGGAS